MWKSRGAIPIFNVGIDVVDVTDEKGDTVGWVRRDRVNEVLAGSEALALLAKFESTPMRVLVEHIQMIRKKASEQ